MERVLSEFPLVAEAAVLGRPDPIRDEAVVAFVVPAAGATIDPAALDAHCRAQLARFKVPEEYVVVDALPKTSIGKIEKKTLRAMIEQSVSSGERGEGRAGVTTKASTLEMLRAPGLTVERSLELSGEWFNQLCLWLQSPIGELGPLGWPMVLIPEIIDSRYRLGDQALQVYQRVEWSKPVPRREFTASGRVEWVSSRTGSFETGVATRARLGDEDLAQSLLVARMTGDLESHGTRTLPPRPPLDETALARRRTLVVDEATVRHFATLAGTHYPVHEDERYAWAQGFPTILVQGLLLFMTQLYYAGVGPTGRGEMWFRRAVPAGSLLESCQSTADPALWAMRLVGGGDVAAIARIGSA